MNAKKYFFGITVVIIAAFFVLPIKHGHEAASGTAADANLFPFITALNDATPDGNTRIDSKDVLIVDAELKQFFDRYLDDHPSTSVRVDIETELERRLMPSAAGEAKRLLARYIAYRNGLADIEKKFRDGGDTEAAQHTRATSMRQLRARFFTPREIQGLFNVDDAVPDMKAALHHASSTDLSALEEVVQMRRARGAGDDEIYRIRATALSPEAAARMAALDQAQTAWKSHLGIYLFERTKLFSGNGNIAGSSPQEALQRLRQASFTPEELQRLSIYEAAEVPLLPLE